jgi:hypothetical protein
MVGDGERKFNDVGTSVDQLLINITNANTEALSSAVANMQFNNIDQVPILQASMPLESSGIT